MSVGRESLTVTNCEERLATRQMAPSWIVPGAGRRLEIVAEQMPATVVAPDDVPEFTRPEDSRKQNQLEQRAEKNVVA